jgi:uncharacterized protein
MAVISNTHLQTERETSSFDEVVRATEDLVQKQLANEPTGHDWWHSDRVRQSALKIARKEGANPMIVELAALLHDLKDYKFTGSDEAGPQFAQSWLLEHDVDAGVATEVAEIIRRMSFRGALVAEHPLTLEGRCVQDADRLDALGAIGIARAFAYGGYVRRPIHDPSVAPVLHQRQEDYKAYRGTTINHFDEKLLLLESRMATPTGKALALERPRFMEGFLAEFAAEWRGRDVDGFPEDYPADEKNLLA